METISRPEMNKDWIHTVIKRTGHYEACEPLLNDKRFWVWSGSSKVHQHHYGDGGLARHTEEVMRVGLEACKLHKFDEGDTNIFLVAALWHDYGKIWDYAKMADGVPVFDKILEEMGPWTGTWHKRHIHHISRSAIEWEVAARQACTAPHIVQFVTHAILAHHGQREFGSPVAPKTRVAWMLHFCDGISARMDDYDTLDVLDR
jgi:3'-5' exoribonuclease